MQTVTLVGAGIVNLITALDLVRHGYDVAVYERAPDPRAGADWTAYGCTRGGGDGRMFTLTEADSYHNRSWHADGTSNGLLNRPISDHGWLVAKAGSLTEAERRWADAFHGVPPELAQTYNDDIFAVNREAGELWTALIDAEPALFGTDTGYTDGVLRVFTEDDYFRWHVARNERVGATRRVLTPGRIAIGYPALEAACSDGTIAAWHRGGRLHRQRAPVRDAPRRPAGAGGAVPLEHRGGADPVGLARRRGRAGAGER